MFKRLVFIYLSLFCASTYAEPVFNSHQDWVTMEDCDTGDCYYIIGTPFLSKENSWIEFYILDTNSLFTRIQLHSNKLHSTTTDFPQHITFTTNHGERIQLKAQAHLEAGTSFITVLAEPFDLQKQNNIEKFVKGSSCKLEIRVNKKTLPLFLPKSFL